MRCSTIEVNRDGEKVIINLSDFDAKIMIKWEDKAKPEFTNNPPPPSRKSEFSRK